MTNNEYFKKCTSLLMLKNAYRNIIITDKKNEGSEIMLRKIIQLDLEIKKFDNSILIRTYPVSNYKNALKWL
jgi:hypothetical protein